LGVNFDKRSTVASHVQKISLMIDIHSVGTTGRKQPLLHDVQFGKSCDQDHGRIADGQEHPLFFRIDNAPARPSGKVDAPSPIPLQSENLELGHVGVVADTSDDRDLQRRNDRDAVRSWPGLQDCPGFQSARIDPSHAGSAAVRDQDAASACDDARRFWKAVECGNVPVGVSVNHLKTVPSQVRNEDAAAFGFESSMVKRGTE
jgi:hypothetical protein